MGDCLVVVAEPHHRAALLAVLAQEGIPVRIAPDAAAALALVAGAMPAAALVAAELPDLHGAILAAGLAAAFPPLRVLLLGAAGDPTPPGVDLLTLPCDRARLRAAVAATWETPARGRVGTPNSLI